MKPRFYSKEAIAIGTIFLTPILGCILLGANLREAGKGKMTPFLIFGSVVWTGLMNQITRVWIPNPLIQLFLSNAIAAALLVTVAWNYFLPDYPVFEKRSPWKVVIIFTGICVALLLLQLWVARRS
jgi:putative flippase GtrA